MWKEKLKKALVLLGLLSAKRLPAELNEEVLAEVAREAAFLHGAHGVKVEALKPMELPGLPRRADEPEA